MFFKCRPSRACNGRQGGERAKIQVTGKADAAVFLSCVRGVAEGLKDAVIIHVFAKGTSLFFNYFF